MINDNWYLHFVDMELSKRKDLTPEEYLQKQVEQLKIETNHWVDVYRNGSNDPFWHDGVSMNLTRNHIIFRKNVILAVCELHFLQIPAMYYTPTPPVVDDLYMAIKTDKLRKGERFAKTFTFKKPSGEVQLTFM